MPVRDQAITQRPGLLFKLTMRSEFQRKQMGLCGWVGAHARAWAATSSIGEAMGSNEATTAASPAITAHGPVPSASGCTHPLPDCLIVFILDFKLQSDLQSLLTHRLFFL